MNRRILHRLILTFTICCFALACKKEMADDCIGKATIVPCPISGIPVCGCNGITYQSSCLAGNAGVKRWVNGPCGH